MKAGSKGFGSLDPGSREFISCEWQEMFIYRTLVRFRPSSIRPCWWRVARRRDSSFLSPVAAVLFAARRSYTPV